MTDAAGSPATILDVARRAGVSRTTVSRVLNEPDRVTTDTRNRVLDAARELRYAPSSVARGLRSGRTGMIALLVGDISQPFHGCLAQSVVAAAEQRGLGVQLHDLGHSTARLEAVLRKLPQHRVDGIVLATADDVSTGSIRAAVGECAAKGLAIVTGVEQGVEGMTAVHTDHSAVTRSAFRALADAGASSPALLVGDVQSPIARQLAAGADGARVVAVGYGFEGARDAVAQLGQEVDALVVATTPMALGALSALGGRQVPVVVCEEVPLAGYVRPGLSTSAVRPEVTGEEMVRLIDCLLREIPFERRLLTPELIRRETF
ncbi:LacI family DNA-binding transcriptional regulator [Amycolatopsis jejuensis]|uniref:LacI family DNA-binding transcriptional regulator n=1 Tax=Amycolatopsis jejuensis TaxID=330084 RepID=UPI000526B8A6|nr:LacI family DNA-binding transcriptional regulator [Amycolatopsis jejuensis]